ncbi:helix-turn-helix domain-containing protein (plasmid) [Cupriavidus pinatubonensis]|uniref:helix-turn-helix domain-containing protein n=1 Tax=Cupriavidus pinatubonensis TaxID=248026 RepID=UPI001C72F9BB|nr:helix-turn-helix transcriptional regulator [Cupriavidus pinatubonensis]QYY33557.1 helix-turn-helix domain-containing protein [Cupriavidus pinatubonensis]
MKVATPYSFQTEEALRTIGAGIRTARLRRGESTALAAQRTGVTRNTWARLEDGSPGVATGLLIEALLVYGFDRQVFALASPEADELGNRLDRQRLPKKGTSRAKV